jgi:hypothetical protein
MRPTILAENAGSSSALDNGADHGCVGGRAPFLIAWLFVDVSLAQSILTLIDEASTVIGQAREPQLSIEECRL